MRRRSTSHRLSRLYCLCPQARDDYLRPQKIREEYDDTFTSVMGLRFEISRHHFKAGVTKLKCSSSLLTIYWQSSTVSARLGGLDNNLLLQVELHEASPRLGRVMGIGQEAEEGHHQVTAVTEETNTEDQLAGELAGKPWPVASPAWSLVIQQSKLQAFTLICLFCLEKLC